METATYAALDPRSDPPAIERIALASRPSSLAELRIALVQTMPTGSGLEPLIEAIAEGIGERFPTAVTVHHHRRNFMMTDFDEIDEIATGFDAAVIVGGPAATMVHLAVIFANELERRGVPAPLVHFDALTQSARHSVSTVGSPLRCCAAPNPPHAVGALRTLGSTVVEALTTPPDEHEVEQGIRTPPERPRVAITATLQGVTDFFEAQGWTDGLPIVPPTESSLAEMLSGTSRDRNDLVATTFRPEGRVVTVEMVAITAVMAGAKPSYLPVILAAASVFGDLQFESMTRSVNSFAFAQVVNGPIAAEIGMTGGLGALGPGNRANATIGRAINLLFRTVGGARAGINVTPTQGSVAAYTMAFAESEAASPWTAMHTDFGFSAEQSAVTILLGGHAHAGNFYYDGLEAVAASLRSFEFPQTGALILVSEKRAHLLAEEGWTKPAIADYLHAHATIRLGDFRACGFWPMSRNMIAGTGPTSAPAWPTDYLTRPDDDIVPGYPHGTINVAVVGSDVSSLIQVWKFQRHTTIAIDPWR